MTFGDIKARIADELVRPDLASQITFAVGDAIKEAAKTAFWFNEVRGLTFTLVPGQQFYDAATVPFIAWLSRIDALWVVEGNQPRAVEPTDALWDGSSVGNGEPYCYSRQANGLVFWMPPSIPSVVYIDGVSRFAPLVADTDTNPYLDEGETYIRALAKAYMFEDVIRDFDEADRQWQKAAREKALLVQETNGRLASRTNAAFL